MPLLSEYSIHAWLRQYEIKNEKGELIDTEDNHFFLFDVYRDRADNLVCMKAAQIGMSTLEVLKNLYDAKRNKMDIIYTLPTDADVNVFVGGKVNRIIANNPILLDYTRDKDSVEQKRVGESMVYFRGTWTKKAAIMVTADRLVHDEKDSSKQDVILDYQARLQHSKFKQTHVFSHPSVPGYGVDVEWGQSDQKHWFITCRTCKKEQFLEWPESLDPERKCFQCKFCYAEISDQERRVGRWVQKYRNKEWSGYWISLLMAPWISAEEIVKKAHDPKQTEDYFFNKVLGLPYVGGGNIVLQDQIFRNLTPTLNRHEGRIVIGVDTGVDIRYVIGNQQGLFFYGECKDYDELEKFLQRWEHSIMVIDQGGDIIGPRKLREKYAGRVFLCHYAKDRKTFQLIRWGAKDEEGNVIADRNRMIQLLIDEFTDKRIPLSGSETDWYDYWLHWSHIYRIWEENEALRIQEYKWERSDRDDWVHATVYWRIGMSRFGQGGFIQNPSLPQEDSKSTEIQPDGTIDFRPKILFKKPDDDDWRN
jgi:hypothetical protein